MRQPTKDIIWIVLGIVLAAMVGVGFGMFTVPQEPIRAVRVNYAPLNQWVYNHSTRISSRIAQDIVSHAMSYDNGLLILAIIEMESNIVPTAVSSKGAIGLGQVMFSVHKDSLTKSGVAKDGRDLFDIDTNIRAIDFLLNDFLKRSNYNIKKALRLYRGKEDEAYENRICKNFVELSLLGKQNQNKKEVLQND